MMFSREQGYLNYGKTLLLAGAMSLSACSDKEPVDTNRQSQAKPSVQQQQAPQYAPPAAYAPPAYPQPPVPGYAPGPYYAPPPPPPPVESSPGQGNPWSGVPRMDSSRSPSTWRNQQNTADQYRGQSAGMTGNYRPLNDPSETSAHTAQSGARYAPGYAPPAYPNGYGAYYPGGSPGYGYGAGWPGGYGGGFPGGYGPPVGW